MFSPSRLFPLSYGTYYLSLWLFCSRTMLKGGCFGENIKIHSRGEACFGRLTLEVGRLLCRCCFRFCFLRCFIRLSFRFRLVLFLPHPLKVGCCLCFNFRFHRCFVRLSFSFLLSFSLDLVAPRSCCCFDRTLGG